MASHISLRKSLAAVLAVLLVFTCAGCGAKDPNTILIPESYYDYFNDSPGDDLTSMRDLGPEYVTRVYRKSGGIAIIANPSQRKTLLARTSDWIDYYKSLILKANSQYSIKNSKDFRKLECCMDYTMDTNTRNEAIEGLVYWSVVTQLFQGAGEHWKLDIVMRDCHSKKVVYRVSIPKTRIDFNEETWNL